MPAKTPKGLVLAAAGTYAELVGRVAANLRRLREARGWSQEEAARHCGNLHVFAYRVVENGQTNFTAASLARVAHGFGVDVAELLQPAAPPAPRPRGRPRKPLAPPLAGELEPALPDEHLPPAREPAGLMLPRSRDRGVRIPTLKEPADAARTTTPAALSVPSPGSRVQVVPIELPPGKFRELRPLLLAVLSANPRGLTSRELIAAARAMGRKRLANDAVHFLLHDLFRRGFVAREGERGGYVYRLKPAVEDPPQRA